MDPHHRKIDLQSPADLTYLHNNIKNAAQQKLDLAIPPQGEDAFRTKVQDYVQGVGLPTPKNPFLIIMRFPLSKPREMNKNKRD